MVSEYVRNRRKELCLTQRQLAHKAGVSLSVVKRFEANKPYDPYGMTITKYCWALGIDCMYALLELEWPGERR